MPKPKQMIQISHRDNAHTIHISVTDEGAKNFGLTGANSQKVYAFISNLVTGLGLTLEGEEPVDYIRNSRGWGFKAWARLEGFKK